MWTKRHPAGGASGLWQFPFDDSAGALGELRRRAEGAEGDWQRTRALGATQHVPDRIAGPLIGLT